MNIERLSPTKQVAAVIKAAGPGVVPDIPPFLRVDAAEQARRIEYARTHPIPPAPKFMESSEPRPVYIPLAEPKKANASARLQTYHTDRATAWVMSLPAADRHWSPRLGRFVPDAILGIDKMPLLAALHAIEHAARVAQYPVENAHRKAKARIERLNPAAGPRAKAVPVKAAAPAKPRVVGKVTGPEADAITLQMLRSPDGVTQNELAARLECTGDAARGRISKVARAKNLKVKRIKEARGGIYYAEE